MKNNTFKNWLDSSYLTENNFTYLDRMYRNFTHNPNSVDISWTNIFNQWSIENNNKNLNNSYKKIDNDKFSVLFIKILKLINAFRTYGCQYSKLDPLRLFVNRSKNNLLELKNYNFTSQELNTTFDTASFGMKQGMMSVENIYKFLKDTYCGSIGIEYMHILDINRILWIQNYYESNLKDYNVLQNTEQKQFLKEIIAAEELERCLGTKFSGTKRFSLEGGEALIPMLKEIIRYSVKNYDVQDVYIGMAHRGRLNVLVNILGKNPKDLFNEFCDNNQIFSGSGDVKYHQGLYSDITINNNTISVSLLFNPSHLEIVTPIVMGVVRSKIDQLLCNTFKKNSENISQTILPIVIHGDAAISAQGIIQETLNMSNTNAYTVGGLIHIIINNQIGFTTSDIYKMRSTVYCTDIIKMIQAPILHVNADDINAVIFSTRFALDFRNKFNSDIMIDLVCYRRHGHNEIDDPSVTQPIMYQKIRNHPTVCVIYANKLKKLGIINCDDIKNITCAYNTKLNKETCVLKKWEPVYTRSVYYSDHVNQNLNSFCYEKNAITSQYLKKLAYHISNIPVDIQMHDRVQKIYLNRMEMALGRRPFDWGAAEILSYATLLDQGYVIRLSGEDVSRGTFFHRHVIIHNQENGSTYVPLMNIREKQGSFFVWDSVLSEESAVSFEYGYSFMSSSHTLVIWEAQFGDFSNGAQIVIDQFISSSEQKWAQLSGLVMLLPHGYEGQGPEHSSCRIERYLQLCAENNMWVCVPSTPAQIFHILRQHASNNVKKPLILVSPKSLLRNPMVTSSIDDLAYGSFNTVFNEKSKNCIINQIKRVIICTGKIYYDLVSERDKKNNYNLAIIRIEQLYPFPAVDIQVVLQSYTHVKDFVWCQEEPKNQGAWYYIQRCFFDNIKNVMLNYVGRADAAAPAVGSFSVHQIQQKEIIEDALNYKNL